jgi:hypothetical protein
MIALISMRRLSPASGAAASWCVAPSSSAGASGNPVITKARRLDHARRVR